MSPSPFCYNKGMITIFNPTKITGHPFFKDLINYLAIRDDVILRQIKRDFPDIANLDRLLEIYIQEGYVCRDNKRYHLTLPLINRLELVTLDSHIMVDVESPIYKSLMSLRFETQLSNQANTVLIAESTTIARRELTLSNYFANLRTAQPLSAEQKPLYDLLGDVNPDYALKYMTTFLLKLVDKNQVVHRRPDVFVEALELLGYIEKIAEQTYELRMAFDAEKMIFSA